MQKGLPMCWVSDDRGKFRAPTNRWFSSTPSFLFCSWCLESDDASSNPTSKPFLRRSRTLPSLHGFWRILVCGTRSTSYTAYRYSILRPRFLFQNRNQKSGNLHRFLKFSSLPFSPSMASNSNS